ncbi:MAG: tetratricopeptide repeat protein [Alphaproteobacteria bacterium]|nr:tetratricopeptide repeat protein [Alphaproteobacteria bacterium]
MSNFTESSNATHDAPFAGKKFPSLARKVLITIVSLGLVALCVILLLRTNPDLLAPNPIKSNLVNPTRNFLLERPQLSLQIEQKLSGNDAIKTVALVGIVGMGGVGKTTLARQFGRSHKASVVWEINAETHSQLIRSFMDLAGTFAKTRLQKEELESIQTLKNQDEKEKQLLSLVKKHLKDQKGWLLLYDNVNAFSEIKDFFPRDETTWGAGKVIITTRDVAFKNADFINPENVIHLDSLSRADALTLFTRILYGRSSYDVKPEQFAEAEKFLDHIPLFPLDVSTAAHYIKNTQISYEDYLKEAKKNSQEFEKSQEHLMKETSDYMKTRYGVIVSVIDRLIQGKPEFEDLLFLLCVMDSQQIPKDVLYHYKDKDTVDKFIQMMRTYSLMTSQASQDSDTQFISLHRSMQAICLSHLLQSLSPDRKVAMIHSISSSLEGYMKKVLDTEDCEKMKTVISHWEAILGHAPLISDTTQGAFKGQLGAIYFYMADYKKAKQNLEESQVLLNRDYDQNFERIARGLSDLAKVDQELGQFKEIIPQLEKSLNIYKKHFQENHVYIARTLALLGNMYKNINKFEQAIEPLEKSIFIYKTYYPENFAERVQAMVFLGNAYRNLGQFVKAKQALEEGLELSQQKMSKDSIGAARIQRMLGLLCVNVGYYKNAEALLVQSTLVYKKMFSKNHPDVGEALLILGHCYRCMGQHEKAEPILKDSLRICLLHSETSLNTVWAFLRLSELYAAIGNYEQAHDCCERSLKIINTHSDMSRINLALALIIKGEICLSQNDYDNAEKYFQDSLDSLKHQKHPRKHIIFENLSDLYLKKSEDATTKGDAQQAADHKIKATDYIKQSFEIAQGHLPPDSPHVARIADKMAKLGGVT